MSDFLSVARSLEIKEISRDVEANDVDTLRGQDNKKNNHQNIETGEKDNFPTNQSKARDQNQIYRLNGTKSHWGLNPPP